MNESVCLSIYLSIYLDQISYYRLEKYCCIVYCDSNCRLDGGVTGSLVIINVYVPRATERDDRWTYKQRFLALLQSRAESLLHDGRYSQYSGDECLSCCVMGGTVNTAVISVCLVV